MASPIVEKDAQVTSRTGYRQLVQRTFFAGPSPEAPEDMYSRVRRGAAARSRDAITLEPHTTVSMNTYFGRFPASYWQRWTAATEVVVDVVAAGAGRLSINASDSAGHERTVASTVVAAASEQPIRLRARLDRFADGGALWVSVSTAADRLEVRQIRWLIPGLAQRDRRSSVVICTYNRAADCLDTLRTLAVDAETLDHLDAVYVVDQGDDVVEAQDGFPAVRRLLGERLRYIRQANLGGAGGFSRGMYEITRAGRHADARDSPDLPDSNDSHVLFMDDDIRLEPDTVVRVATFANHTREPMLVGGQMLCALHPDQLYVDAEDIDAATLRAGVPATAKLVRASMLRRRQERRVDAAYNAWWCCLIPREAVDAIGLPLPLFFQWDDVEYGLRARATGFRTATLPGAGVWHSDFHWRNWDDWSRYFHFRNGLITTAMHGEFDVSAVTGYLAKQLFVYLVSMRYGLAMTMIKAVEDFLAGPLMLADGGVEAAATIRKLRAEFPDTVCHSDPELYELPAADMGLAARGNTPSMPRVVLLARILRQLMNRPRPAAFVSAENAQWWHVSRFRTAVVTDPSQQGFRVHRLDRELMLRLARRGFRALWRLRTRGKDVGAEYRSATPGLTSRDSWTRLFETK